MLLFDVAIETSQPKGPQPQKSGTATEQFRETQTENQLVPFLNSSENCPNETQETDNQTTATLNGHNKIPPLIVTAPQIEENCKGIPQWRFWKFSPSGFSKRFGWTETRILGKRGIQWWNLCAREWWRPCTSVQSKVIPKILWYRKRCLLGSYLIGLNALAISILTLKHSFCQAIFLGKASLLTNTNEQFQAVIHVWSLDSVRERAPIMLTGHFEVVFSLG